MSAGTVQCVECAALDLRSSPAFAKLGFGRCTRERKGPASAGHHVSITYRRECATFTRADEKTVEQRRAWITKLDTRRNPAA